MVRAEQARRNTTQPLVARPLLLWWSQASLERLARDVQTGITVRRARLARVPVTSSFMQQQSDYADTLSTNAEKD